MNSTPLLSNPPRKPDSMSQPTKSKTDTSDVLPFSVKYGKTQIFTHNTDHHYFQEHCPKKDQ